MENQNDPVDRYNKMMTTTTAKLLERSAELKKKNAEVVKKLENLKKQAQEVLHNNPESDN